jgi:putative addiction module killer protein
MSAKPSVGGVQIFVPRSGKAPFEQWMRSLRMHCGPGYRVYFGLHGSEIVLLLCGGDNTTQAHDIEMAKAYWQEYTQP